MLTFKRLVVILSRTSLIAADFLLILTTWVTLSPLVDLGFVYRRSGFTNVLLRDGEAIASVRSEPSLICHL